MDMEAADGIGRSLVQERLGVPRLQYMVEELPPSQYSAESVIHTPVGSRGENAAEISASLAESVASRSASNTPGDDYSPRRDKPPSPMPSPFAGDGSIGMAQPAELPGERKKEETGGAVISHPNPKVQESSENGDYHSLQDSQAVLSLREDGESKSTNHNNMPESEAANILPTSFPDAPS